MLSDEILANLVCCHLQNRAGQIAVRDSEFIQNSDVVFIGDPAACDHCRQLARTIRDGKRRVDARPQRIGERRLPIRAYF